MKKIILTAFTFFGLASLTMAQVPAYVPTNGLVGWWPFTGNANDLSGNGNNGVVTGAALSTDRNGISNNAYLYSGAGNFIIVPNSTSLQFNGGITISAWLYASAFPAPVSYWFSKGADGGTPYSWCSSVSAGTKKAQVDIFNNVNLNCNTISTSSLQLNTWIHLVQTFNGVSSRTFVNGVLESTAACSYTTFSNTYDLIFGKRHISGLPYYWNGKIDDFGLWNRALTPCEITQLYNTSVFTTPTITSIGSTTLCSGKTATLSASATGSYTWSNGATTQSITVSNAGSYSVAVSNGTCTGNAPPILISVNPLPTISVTSGTICNGQSFTITPNGASTYTIQGGSAIITPTTSTSYTVIGTSSIGCVSQSAATSSVTVNQNPIIAVDNVTICAGQSATLNASGATTYTWNTNANTAAIVVSPSNTINYSVSGTSNSCTSIQTVQLLVSACTSIKELQAEQQLSISPNPNSGQFIITAETTMQIKITDHLGRHIKTIDVKPGKNAYHLNDLSIGVYLLSGEANGRIYKGKMVIN
jgi:hypothetical protein